MVTRPGKHHLEQVRKASWEIEQRRIVLYCEFTFMGNHSPHSHPTFLTGDGSNWIMPEALFDDLPDTVFFIKDRSGRYVVVNQTLADRCAGGDKAKLIGRRPDEVFPADLAATYARQDESVLKTGGSITQQLELHIYPRGVAGWCLTTKHAVRTSDGRIVGLTGISRDLHAVDGEAAGYAELARALRYMKKHFAESLRIEDLAGHCGLSVYQFEQRVRKLYKMSPLQLLHKHRLDEGTRLLRESDLSLAEIALQTGWCDQSAFTRHFSRFTGMAPGKFRRLNRPT